MKNISKLSIIALLALLSLQSCYDEYKNDFDYTSTYFALQYPDRYAMIQEDGTLKMELGVMLGGIYPPLEKSYETNYKIVADSLTNYPQYTLLPADYYTLSNSSKFEFSSSDNIEGTDFLGRVTLTFKDAFINDTAAHTTKYALPLQITSSTADSILPGMDYSVIAIRYVNQYYGQYRVKGVDNKLDASGNITSSSKYSEEEYIDNTNFELLTLSKTTSEATYFGSDHGGSNTLKLTVASDNRVTVEAATVSGITEVSGTGIYDENAKEFRIQYVYTKSSTKHSVSDTISYFAHPVILLDALEWQ